MLLVSNLSKSYGNRILFEDLGFSLAKKEIVGLVGRNGCGKSTLFRVILGQEIYESGSISTPKGYKIGHLSQHIEFTHNTVLEECCQMLSEEEKYDFYKAERILSGLGFSEEDFYRSPHDFSGGFQLRINLTKTLLTNPDLLLLDEPTNYLDIPSLRWMRLFLKSFAGEVILITHDRGFMDSVSTHTMGIHRHSLRKIQGPTSKYYDQLAEEEELHEKTRQNREKKIAQLQSFVDRFRAQATKARQAQSKLKQIDRLSGLDELSQEQILGFRFNYKESPAKKFLTATDLSFGFNKGDNLFEKLNFELRPGQRLAVIGKNGRGKTTLLNVLAGQLDGHKGEIRLHDDSAIAYYQQTNRKNLDPKKTIVEEVESCNSELSHTQCRSICGAMMFSGAEADKKIAVLSGGEQGRVLLAKILASPSNLLLLDEPTNHLDMESVDVMINEIDRFPGAVVFVSHNEDMLRKLATDFIVFRKQSAAHFHGSYDEFLEKIGWDEQSPKKNSHNKSPDNSKKQAKSENKKKPQVDRKKQKEIDRAEGKIIDLEERIESHSIRLSESPANEERNQLSIELAYMQKELQEWYDKFEKLTATL